MVKVYEGWGYNVNKVFIKIIWNIVKRFKFVCIDCRNFLKWWCIKLGKCKENNRDVKIFGLDFYCLV